MEQNDSALRQTELRGVARLETSRAFEHNRTAVAELVAHSGQVLHSGGDDLQPIMGPHGKTGHGI
jgi:hypothetical protein